MNKMEKFSTLVRRPTFLLKIAELGLAVACAVLVGTKAQGLDIVKAYIIIGTILGYINVNVICILSYVLKTVLHKYITVLIALGGCGLFIASGVFMLELDETLFRAPAICALVNGGLYFVDGVLTFREVKPKPKRNPLAVGMGIGMDIGLGLLVGPGGRDAARQVLLAVTKGSE